MDKLKYIITRDKVIIVFPGLLNHSDFKDWEPISAGFISFGTNVDGAPTCNCYGRSISLDLPSRPEEDTLIAKRQLGMLEY